MGADKSILRYLGVDWGEKRIGLAIAESGSRVVIPYGVVGDVAEVLSVVKKEGVDKVIVGLPVKMSGVKNETPEKFNIFVKRLQSNLKTEIEFVDERLTSKAADALPGDKKNKAARDAIAAMLILQTYLDKLQ